MGDPESSDDVRMGFGAGEGSHRLRAGFWGFGRAKHPRKWLWLAMGYGADASPLRVGGLVGCIAGFGAW
jgi:hypothetical protein